MSAKTSEKDMNLVGHLTELRNRLIVTAIWFVVAFLASFTFIRDIYAFFENDIHFQLTITSPADTIWIFFTMAGIVAIAATLPLLALQVWLFIKPALTSKERKSSLPYVPAIFLLFVGGLVFGYFIFIKLILPFLLSLNDGMFNELFTVDRYFKFLFRMTLPFAFLFEIPIIAMFLTSLGLLSPAFLRKVRKYAYFILLIVGALVTPPDVVLQVTVAIPMFILYEISIYLSAAVYRKKERKHREFMEQS
ncbi:Sec-independent protein translocase protein TatCd [Lentibacillus sp. JNUCC-1]|uniref:twin-arginine translocase subunit TatC n=1 Tax=Lentibacillus sp. JNUCC-1 TaxID=2654513 RepID=UPI0012E76FD9|nr:twin-arginine translocase subunit TatC [Lentibacillus sp. JNUCC-1]MUV39827.1 Sec-independent protein translocase protein TatCd [Lentibacillus sp. JNUCC-1]